MRRAVLLSVVVAALAVAAAPASAATQPWTGIVVAKDVSRSAVVTASSGGALRTVRVAPRRAGALRLGARLSVRAQRLADGTFRAASVRVTGKAKRARVRAVVVRYQRKLSRYLVSGGGTVFAINRRAARALSSSHEPNPGDQISATVTVQNGSLQTGSVETTGHVGTLEIEGILTEVAPTALKLVVARAGFVTVAVPVGLLLPPSLKAFDEVELVVSVGTEGGFTLVTLQGDEGEDEDGQGVELDGDELEVHGTISALGADSVSVQPGAGTAPVTCSLPVGTALTGFQLNDRVEMECRAVAPGQFVLRELESEDSEFEVEDDEDDDDEEDEEDEDDEEDDD